MPALADFRDRSSGCLLTVRSPASRIWEDVTVIVKLEDVREQRVGQIVDWCWSDRGLEGCSHL